MASSRSLRSWTLLSRPSSAIYPSERWRLAEIRSVVKQRLRLLNFALKIDAKFDADSVVIFAGMQKKHKAAGESKSGSLSLTITLSTQNSVRNFFAIRAKELTPQT